MSLNQTVRHDLSTGRTPQFRVPRAHLNSEITRREWLLHGSLFLITTLSAILAGTMLVAPQIDVPEPPLATFLDYVFYVPKAYLTSVEALVREVIQFPSLLLAGLSFASSLLCILFAHEMGHYLACRWYGVNATLPYFIPAPPLFLAGTFGAFIKIRSPIPSRRALFDIGLAGPLAGFVIAFPIAIIGLLELQPPIVQTGSGIVFNDPLLFRMLARLLGIQLVPNSPINPYYMAAWIGLLVTSLNLMPVGQLDGGHGTFAMFGSRAHKLIGRLSFFTVAVLALLGFWWYASPSGFLYAVLLGIMLRVRHPQPAISETLGWKRLMVAIITCLVFVLCFVPFPITIQ